MTVDLTRAAGRSLLVACLCLAGLPLDAQGQDDPDLSSRISGVVVTDTGAPLPDARVVLSGVRRPGASLEVQTWSETATSRSDGTFDFPDIPAGDFTLGVNKAGYLSRAATQVTVAARQTRSVSLTLSRGGAITGRIVDAFGDPVAGIQVQALWSVYDPAGVRALSTIGGDVTDDLGRFRVYGLMAGDFTVVAFRRGAEAAAAATTLGASGFRGAPLPGGALESPPTYYPGTVDIARAQTVSLRAGQEASANFALQDGRLTRISGRAVDSTGAAVAGSLLMLRSSNFTVSSHYTSPDGSFQISGVVPGNYTIDIPTNSRSGEHGTVAVNAADDVEGVSIVTSPAGMLIGTIEYEGDYSSRSSSVRLLRIENGGPAMVGSMPTLTTLQDRRFEARNVAGRFIFVSGDPNWTVKSVTLGASDIRDAGIDPNGKSVSGIRVVVTDKLTTVTGRAVDDRGQPLADQRVLLFRTDGLPPNRQEGLRLVRTGSDGTFKVWGLRPGAYAAGVISQADDGSETSPDSLERLRLFGERFSLGDQQTVTLELKPSPGLP
jgi:protocatechuate 3,4-dioxygenase beta subunit